MKKDIISTQSISNISGQINNEASTTSDSLTSIVGGSKQEELSISSDTPEALVISDKDGNPLDFSKDTGSSSGTNKLGSN